MKKGRRGGSKEVKERKESEERGAMKGRKETDERKGGRRPMKGREEGER
jgi:hypothetical protein